MNMATNEPRYGMVLAGGKSEDNYYDIVYHEPGRIDRILARRARHDDAVDIIEALNLRHDRTKFFDAHPDAVELPIPGVE
jgi:hypothetical protein